MMAAISVVRTPSSTAMSDDGISVASYVFFPAITKKISTPAAAHPRPSTAVAKNTLSQRHSYPRPLDVLCTSPFVQYAL